MKLTEQQLAQLFIQSKTSDIDSGAEHLLNNTDASDERIAAVEKIANNSHLSASYQSINQLKDWSKSISHDINSELTKPSLVTSLLDWLKPTLATAAIVTAVYFIVPNVENTTVTPNQSEQPMFSGSFEKGKNNVLPKAAKPPVKSDIIYKGNFG